MAIPRIHFDSKQHEGINFAAIPSIMKWKLKTGIAFVRTVRNNFFLRRHELQPATLQILQKLYPQVNWNRVDFYEGLPWFTPVVAPYVNAQALPQFYSFSRFRIYLRKFDETRAQCLADIVHEAFHVMQAMHFGKGYGLGFFRGWLLFYISHFLSEGYRQNVFEIPAYNQEYRFLAMCEKHGIAGVFPQVDGQKILKVTAENSLIFPHYHYRYTGRILMLPAGFAICLATTILKPLADAILFVLTLPARNKHSQPATSINSE